MAAPPDVIFHPEAEEEVRGAHAWYLERSPPAAHGFLTATDHAVEQVGTAPERWPQVDGPLRRYVYKRFPYSLIYAVVSGQVTIFAVAHERRRPGYWAHRLRP